MKLVSYATLGLFAILTATFFSAAGCKSSTTTVSDDAGITCVDGGVVLPPVACELPTLDCGAGYCTDSMTDSDNCGACGKSCDAGAICCGGKCVPPGPGNCGYCGGTCDDPTHPNCAVSGRNAACVDSNGCMPGEIFCGGKCSSSTDRGSCGSCDLVCTGDKICLGTSCGDCWPGTIFCSGTQNCATLEYDPNNCGACGQACGPTQACTAGRCEDPPPGSNPKGPEVPPACK